MTFGDWMQGICAIGFALLLCATSATAQDQAKLNLMPMPSNLQTGTDDLRIDSSFSVALTGHTDHASREIQELGEGESYTLSIAPDGARIDAPTPLGAMHALRTFLQLVEVSPNGFAAPALTIQDKPRFPWRGLMIDVARHFIP